LAIRCLGYLGLYEPMILILNSTDPRGWNECVAYLQSAIDRDPDSAAAVRQSLEKTFSQDASLLYRMLWGYSDEELAQGAATTLVNTLNHDSLACRVLAFSTLKRIAGAEYGYRPHDPANKRNAAVSRWIEWRDRLSTKPEEKKPSPTPLSTSPAKSRDL
jgi:hypothetical protein